MTLRERRVGLGEEWEPTSSGLLVPPGRRYELPVGVDLFAGAGGFSCGFHQAGWHVVAAVENDPAAALTYLVNLARPGVRIHFLGEESEDAFLRALRRQWGLRVHHGPQPREFDDEDLARLDGELRGPSGLTAFAGSGWIAGQPARMPGCEHFYLGDICDLSGERLLADLGLERGEVDWVFGGPPCQGFSVSGKRNVMDPRNSLVFEFTRLVREVNPKSFAMENVRGMASMVTEDGVPLLDALALDLERGGYGTLGALKNMLQASAGVGAAVRPGELSRDEPRAAHGVDAEAEPDQLALALE